MITDVIFDIDGTLCTNEIHHFDDGDKCYRGRTFSTLDSKGIWLLKENGISVWICGGDNTPHLCDRLIWMGIESNYWMLAPKDKRAMMDMIGLTHAPNTAHMGNDVPDLPLMEMVGLVACPADAHNTVWEYVARRQQSERYGAHYGYLCDYDGGKGAVREFCDWLIEYNKSMAEGPRR